MSIGQHFANCPLLTDCRFCRLRLGADLGGGVGVEGGAGSKKGDVQMEKGEAKPRLVRAGIWLVSSAVIGRE